MCAKHESWFNKWRIDVAFSSVCTSRRHFGVVVRHPSGGGTSLLEGIFPLNWPIRARLFLLAPRPKSRRHHIRGYKIPLPPPIVGYHSNVQSWRMFLNNTLRHFLCKRAPELEVFWCFHEKCPNWSVLWKCGLDIVCRCTRVKVIRVEVSQNVVHARTTGWMTSTRQGKATACFFFVSRYTRSLIFPNSRKKNTKLDATPCVVVRLRHLGHDLSQTGWFYLYM